ncbi:hypothetical protein TNIN_495881 [Trichonephila inaurata madagascariensis]|uniref:Uncharacterized protein n=1 Tax=Trichonephila inaurata madagascariensis TaxID=2747483 RepID=A0A8X6YK24_9ARAC|nr:hypothetical protein TNIN_495881 [Trichonephila inaurata madagascariensis]
MKFILILLFAVLAIASAQRRVRVHRPSRPLYRLPIQRYRLADDDQYAASLGGADVGRYSREQFTRRGYGRFGDYQETEVSGLSLGGAKVGLYSRERDGRPYYG